ncbi:MAG: prenyltransferase [Candidatus Latescibacteria bacterium]|nr:prenyltransferase [Candidatus Latescibacterota bacterium]
MKNQSYLKVWLAEIRANFLILSVVLVMIGGTAARYHGSFHPGLFIITLLGIVFAHISVNLFNEYSDWKTGIDFQTNRTPFSGGSGMLQQKLLYPRHVKTASWITLFGAFLIGLMLAWISGWPVLVFMIIGGLTTIFYTDFLTRYMIGELASGITLGSLVVIGTYFVQTSAVSSEIIWASISPGILTMLLLFLNEFPDAEADIAGGRRHMVIVLGKHKAAYVYTLLLLTVYVVIIGGVIFGELPLAALISLVTLPLAAIVSWKTIKYKENNGKLIPALGMNVAIVLVTDFLMALSFIIA